MIAGQDRLPPRYDLYLTGITGSVDELEDLVCSIRVLLGRLRDRSGTHAVSASSGLAEDSWSGESTYDKIAPEFQYTLLTLQHIALDAILRHFHDIAEAHIPHWRYWQFQWQHPKRIGDGWFAEWPNSHRPLSTTWPWNVKPSLLVLWGVCWMFYGHSGNNKKRQTRNARGAAPLSEDLGIGLLGSQSQPSQQSISFRQPSCAYTSSLTSFSNRFI